VANLNTTSSLREFRTFADLCLQTPCHYPVYYSMSSNAESDVPQRIRTRGKNVDVHPGTRYKEATMSRQPPRPREVIQKEKDEKAAAQQARADAKLLKEAGKERAKRLEQEKMATSALDNEQIPRRLPVKKGMCKIVPSVL
jgi:hypothetical protein